MSLKDITLGRYVHGTSIIHRLDPRTKFISLLLLMGGVFGGKSWPALIVAGLFTMTACLLSGLSPRYMVRSLMPFKWLILVTVVLNMLFVGGHILVEAPLPYGGITREGLEFGLLYGGRITLLVLAASLLTLTTEPIILVAGVEKMLAPLSKIGVRPHEVATAMVITIRFIPVLLDEAVKIRKSHAARGFDPGKGLGNRLKSVSLHILPLFGSAIRRAEHLAIAMDCRLYRCEAQRSRYKEIRMAASDWTALAISGIVSIGMVML